MTSKPENPSPAGGRPGPERFFKGHKLPMSPAEALQAFGHCMTEHEHWEITAYSDIWFLGLGANKTHGSRYSMENNHGFDNEDHYYKQVTGDHIGYRYEVLSVLGNGSYGQVLKCLDHEHNELVALKILRNQPRQGLAELRILQHLLEKDPEDAYHAIRMKDGLVFRNHICIAFELLGSDLFSMVLGKGLSESNVRKCASSILKCLQMLERENIVHGDLKLQNMVISNEDPETLKVIDFGASEIQDKPKHYGLIQTPFIRAPEVTLGLLCTNAMDMWSFGCCMIGLLSGKVAFFAEDELEQLMRTIEILGMPPAEMVALSLRKDEFFDKQGRPILIRHDKLGKDILPGSKGLESVLRTRDPDLLDFIKRCLHWDASKRMTPGQALKHPWMTETSLKCTFPCPVLLKTLAPIHLKPHKATVSQPKATDQGEAVKLGKYGKILRPVTLAALSKIAPIGSVLPAPPYSSKRATAIRNGAAANGDLGTMRPVGQVGFSRVPPIGAAAPAPLPGVNRATVTIDIGEANGNEGTTRPAGRSAYPLLPPIGVPPPRVKSPTGTKEDGAVKSDPGSTKTGSLFQLWIPFTQDGRSAAANRNAGRPSTRDPDPLDFIKPCLHCDASKRMTPGQALKHPWMTETSLKCTFPCPVLLKTLAPIHLKPHKATVSQPKATDQGEALKLGKYGKILKPVTLAALSKIAPIGSVSPAPPYSSKRATAIRNGAAANGDLGTMRPVGQVGFSRVPPIGAAAPAPLPGVNRATVTIDIGEANGNEGTTRPAGRSAYPLLPPIGVPPPRVKSPTGTKEDGAVKSDPGSTKTGSLFQLWIPFTQDGRSAAANRNAGRPSTRDPDPLDFIKPCLHCDASKRMTPGQALKHPWMTETSLKCTFPCPVLLKTLAPIHLKPHKATVSQPKATDQGEAVKLGKYGKILKPVTLAALSKIAPIGSVSPPLPYKSKRATAIRNGAAANGDLWIPFTQDGRSATANRKAGRPSPVGQKGYQAVYFLHQDARAQLVPKRMVEPKATKVQPHLAPFFLFSQDG